MLNLKHHLRHWWFAEAATALLLVVIAGAVMGWLGAKSAILAVLAYGLPNAFRSYKMFRHQGAQSARLIVKGFYQGEMLKFLLSVVIFSLVFMCCTVNPVIFFGTYMVMQMLIWFVPLLIK